MPAIQRTLRRLLSLPRKSSRRAIQRRVTTSVRMESSRARRGNKARRLNGLITVLKMLAKPPSSQNKIRGKHYGHHTWTDRDIPLDELLPLPKLHPAETDTAKEKELNPAQQVESVGKSTGSTAANESAKPSADASNGLATEWQL